MRRRFSSLLLIPSCACLVLHAARAHAGNDDGVLVGNDAALMAGAVTATVVDGSALWYNPAGLAAARVDTVDVSGSAFVLRTYHAKELLSGADGSNSDAKVTEIVSVPSALTFVRKLAPGLNVGAGTLGNKVFTQLV